MAGNLESGFRRLAPDRKSARSPKSGVEAPSGNRDSIHSLTAQAITKADTAYYDWLMQRRGPHNSNSEEPGVPEVTIIAIDDQSVESVIKQYQSKIPNCQYPFPRSIIADLIRKLKRSGATVVGLDMIFTEPSAYNLSKANPDDDRTFAIALRDCGNVVLASPFNNTRGQKVNFEATSSDFPINLRVREDFSPDPKDALIFDSARAACPVNICSDSLDDAIRRFQFYSVRADIDDPTHLKDYLAFAPMIAALWEKNHHIGMNAKEPRKYEAIPQKEFEAGLIDDISRGIFLNSTILYHSKDVQSIDQQVDALPRQPELREKALRIKSKLERVDAIKQSSTNEDSSVRICFAGFPGKTTCKSVSLAEALNPENEGRLKEWFANKVVLVGSYLAGEHNDAQNTPLTQNESDDGVVFSSAKRFGVEIHASIIHTLLSKHYYRNVDERVRIGVVAGVALLVALLVVLLKPIRASIPVALLIGFIVFETIYLFDRYQVLPPTQIFTSAGLAFLAETVFFYGIEDRKAKKARVTFNRYVGPKVLATVLDTNFVAGTVEKRYATILFSDVQGFTSLAEKIDPKEAVLILNRYLEQMVDILDEYEGVLDKIMGDGVMAYFNAPSYFPVEGHEQKAVLCALKMQEKMNDWRKVSEAEGLPPLKIRIGIHAGEVIVGEIGAKRQLGFTVIGDAVNTAARLEPLNKEFGSEILISQAVKDKLDSTILTEFKGELEIRGRKEGIRAYSVTGKKNV